MKLEPLTREEQEYAEEHLSLVRQFLHSYKLPEDEYYDVVVFGYLNAVQMNFRIEIEPEKRNFYALAWRCMKSCYVNDCRNRTCFKRKAEYYAVSLDEPRKTGDCDSRAFTLHDVLPDSSQNIEKYLTDTERITQAFSLVSERERTVFLLHQHGYKCREIADCYDFTVRKVWKILSEFRAKINKLSENGKYRETEAEYQRRYRETHRKEIRAYAAKRRAEKKAASDAGTIESGMAQTGL